MSGVEIYELEKAVWTEEDFQRMGWHGAKVWGMLANPDEWEFRFVLSVEKAKSH